MSNNRMLALVAILAGGLMVGACGDSVTGPDHVPILPDDTPKEVSSNPGGITLPPEALINDPEGNHHEKGFPHGGAIE
jgi:hypothetical protein